MGPSLAGLKRAGRPLAARCRLLIRRAGDWLRPGRPWDGRHHPVFARFTPWSGQSDGRFMIDFLGIRTDPRYRRQWRPTPAGPVVTRIPSPYAGYFELAAVLTSVIEAREADQPIGSEVGRADGKHMRVTRTLLDVTPRLARAVAGDVDHAHRHVEQSLGFDCRGERAGGAIEPAAGWRAGDDLNFAFGVPDCLAGDVRHRRAKLRGRGAPRRPEPRPSPTG